MANFSVSNILTAQTMVSDKYKAAEMRMKPAPAFSLLTGNDNFLIQEAASLKTRDDRPIEAHLFARTKRNSGAARAHNHTGTFDDSQKVTLTWTTKSDVTSISLKLLDKSLFDFNTVLANKLEQCAKNILEDKETEAIAYLAAQKATAQPAGLKNGTFANGAVEIDAINDKKFFQIVRSIARQNYFGGTLDIIADSVLAVQAEFLAAQGIGNATNYGFQFKNVNIAESVEYANANYAVGGSAYVMPQGNVAALNWIPKQNREGWGDYESFNGGYGVFQFMGYTFALHAYAQRSDTSASNGATQDVTMEFELSLDSSFNKAPLNYVTGRTDSVIIEVGQKS
jgi:hypothetical protein